MATDASPDVVTSCEHCAHSFEVPRTRAGSIQNCPSCGRATTVAGRFDPGWEAVVGLAVVLVLAAGAIVGLTAGPMPGVLTAAGLGALLYVLRLTL